MSGRVPLLVYCADIGSIRAQNFAWARHHPGDGFSDGTDIVDLAVAVAKDLSLGLRVALGFECPLFVPIPDDPMGLTSARCGEGTRPWCAGAGAGALATGLTEVVWVLREIRRLLSAPVAASLDRATFEHGAGLYLWEALISGSAKGKTHVDDARIGVRAFLASLPDPVAHNAIQEKNVYSLIGAALLRSEWSADLSLLRSACVVIRAQQALATARKDVVTER